MSDINHGMTFIITYNVLLCNHGNEKALTGVLYTGKVCGKEYYEISYCIAVVFRQGSAGKGPGRGT
ncbi:hypothetical protein F240042I4_58560 [Eisenbergiella tayi]